MKSRDEFGIAFEHMHKRDGGGARENQVKSDGIFNT